MKKNVLAFVLFIYCIQSVYAQHQTPIKKGTIKIQKNGHLAKIVFDDVNYRLIGIDIYGNIMDTTVLEFKMGVTIKGIVYKTSTVGNNLSSEMQQLVDRRDSKTTLYFKDIKAKDRNNSIFIMPDFSFTFPYSREEE